MNTDTTKRYRLLKELPDSKVGDIYTWNDTFNHYYKEGNDYGGRWHSTYVENNPEWFEEVLPVSEPVKERIEVLKIEYLAESIIGNTHLDIKFSNGVTPGKFKLIKKAIEWVLENPETTLYDKSYVEELQKRLTQSEVDTIRKEAFEAGRKHDGTPKYGFVVWEYPIYEQYLSSLNLNTNDTDKGEKFKLGDVVIHKAGGLPMTCDGYKNETEVKCQWFDKASRKFGVFHESVLMPYTAPEQPTNGNAFVDEHYWEQELHKCKINPYYYATKYLTVNGQPFTTRLTETEFNDEFNRGIGNAQSKQSPPLSEIKEGNAPTTPAKPIVEETISSNNDDVACLSLNDLLDSWITEEQRKSEILAHADAFYRNERKNSPLFKLFQEKAKQKLKSLNP